MIYENYEKKMLRVAKVRDTLRKHRLKIIIGACILFAAIAVLLFLNGMIVKDISGLPERITYGETLSFESGGAIFGSTYCEYSEAGSDEWTTEQPEMPGEYAVRLVSVRTFGIKSYGETHTFTIDRFKAELTIPSVSVVYGEDPELSVGLVGGDRVEAVDFSYAGLTAASPLARSGVAGSVEVTAGADSVTVVNSEGEDVSAAYEFTPVTVTLDVLPRDITITSGSAEKVYDGTPLTCESSTVTDGSLAEGDSYAVASYNAAITNVAESGAPNTISVSDITFSGSWGDVTPFYNVTAESGTLSVTKRPLSLETSGGEKMYDGGALTAESYTVTGGTLAGGQNIIATDWTALTRAGSAENTVDFRILAGEEDVTANYDISVTCGTLTVTPRPVTITTDSPTKVYDGLAAQPYGSTEHGFTIGGEGVVEGEDYGMLWTGSATLVSDTGNENTGTFTVSSSGEDVTDCYDITYVFGTFTITKRPITLTSADAEKVYDGTPLTNEAYEITSGGLAATDGIEATFTGAITYVAESRDELNTFSVTVIHSSFGDVTDCYKIEYIFGGMTVLPRPISVVMEDADKVYDGTALTSDAYHLDASEEFMELVDGETLIVDGSGSITNVGEEENDVKEWYVSAADGEDRSGNYTLSSVSGTLTVTPRSITIKAADAEREYNGCAIDAHGSYEVLGEYGLADGQNITQIITLHGEYIKAGTYETAHTVEEGSVIISAFDGSEVTANYDISYSSGTLTITKRAITITSGSDSKMYDGQPLKCEEYDITSGSRAETDTITATFTESVTFVSDGTADNKFTVVMTHSDPDVGEVTDSYDISYVYGTLKITPRPITITSEGETKPYDGTPLTGSGYSIAGEGLAEGDKETVYFDDVSITHVYESGAAITFSVEITHPSGRDATGSYEITKEEGTLTITSRPATVTLTYDGKTYDGYRASYAADIEGAAGDDIIQGVMPDYIIAGTYTAEPIRFEVTHDGVTDERYLQDYGIDFVTNEFTISKRAIALESDSLQFVYDGKAHTGSAYEITAGEIAATDEISITFTNSVTYVTDGEVENAFTVTIKHSSLGDVTESCYDISCVYGTLMVTPRPVSIKVTDAEKVYDGMPLTSNDYAFTSDTSVAEGDTLTIECDGEITDVIYLDDGSIGSVANNMTSWRVVDGEGVDRSENYRLIDITSGTLTIRPRGIMIAATALSKVYDGREFTVADIPEGTLAYYLPGQEPGLAEGHSLEVSTSHDSITFAGSVPHVVGDVTIWAGDDDVTDNYAITRVDSTVTVTPRLIRIMSGSATKVYDGQPLTNETYEIKEGSLAETDTLCVVYGGASATFVSDGPEGRVDNTFSVSINHGETDATGSYYLILTYGKLEITPRPITITSGSADKIYDGTPLTGDAENGYEITEGKLVEGDDLTVTFGPGIIHVRESGEEKNTFEASVSKDGKDITSSYSIAPVYGSLTVYERAIDITITGGEKTYDGKPFELGIKIDGLAPTDNAHETVMPELIDAGEYKDVGYTELLIRHDNGDDSTDDYVISTYTKCDVTIYTRLVSVKVTDIERVYDGTLLTSNAFEFTDGTSAADGETLILTCSGNITNAGSTENGVTGWKVVDTAGNDRSHNYELTHSDGILTITPRPIEIKAADKEKEYDGYAIDAHGSYEVLGEYGLADGQNITQITTLHDEYIKAGTYENAHTVEEGSVIISVSDGSEVTANYDISYLSGTLTITKRAITITSGSDSKMYDGQPLKCEEYDITSGSRAETDTITATFTESVTFVSDGTADNKFTVVMTHSDPDVGEVTDSYDISYVYGTLKITPRPITITSEGETKPYDGTPLKGSRYTLTGDLAENDDLTVTFGSGIIHARESGAFKNTFSAKITHPSGVDATSSYDISRIFGRLDVTRISLGIVITGGEKTYDGKPFEFTVEFVGLAETDSGYAVMPECIDAGEYTVSYVSYSITHSNGSDSTGDYDPVDCTPGNTTILKRCVSITMTDAKKEYDGTSLTSDAFEIADDTTLAEGDTLTVDGSGSITDVLRDEVTGEVIGVPNGVDVDGSGTWCVTAPDGRDVTHNYTLSVTEGTLTITPRVITITAVSLSKEYDRTTFGESEYKDKYETVGLRLVSGHRIKGFTTSVSGDMPVYPGETAEHIADVSRVVILDEFGYDKTFNYDITGEGGTLSVTKRVIVYTTETKSWEYDGLPHSAPDIVVKGGTFLDGDVAEALQATQITEVGSLDNVVTYTVTGEDGSDVSAYYDLVLSDEGYGTLTITPKVIKLESGSAEKEYDGTPLTCYLVYGTEALSDGDTLHVTGCTSITDPGEITNELTVVITDADGNDVTSRYSIVWKYGALKVYGSGGSGGGGSGDDSGGGSPSGIDTSGSLAGGEMTPGNNDGDIVMLMIRSSVGGTVYLRLMSYGDYIYSGWDKAYEYTGSDLSPLYYATESLIAGGAETATLDVINYANDYVLPYYIATYSQQKGDVTITSSDTGGYSVGYIPGDYLTESEAFSRISLSGMSAYESYVLSEYLTVPEDTKTQLLSLASEAGISADDPDVINKVAEYIRNAATYDLEYDSAMDEKDDVVVSFLTEYKRGVCRHFASAAALMYRALGIPARYTIGYAASAASGEWSPVTAKNAHAWTEVYISGVGWVAVDATGVPDHTEEPDTEEKITLRVVTDSAEKVYDGEPLTCLNYTLLDDGALLAGHKLSADEGNRRTSSRTDAGTVYNSIGFTVSDSGGADVTDMYEIKIVEYGTLTVTPRPITLKVADKSKPYDGYPLTSNEVVVAEDSAYRLVSDHAISATCGGSITDPGTADNDVVELKILDGSGNDMTANYDVTVLPGSLTVTAAPVVSLSSYAFTYDGTPHTVQPDDILWVKGGSTDVKYTVSNVELHMTDESGATVAADRLINAGVYDIVIDSFELYENGKLAATYSDGEISYTGDASAETGHVTVDTDSGTIIISPAMLYIISDSAERPYMEDENGDPVPLTAPGWSVWMGSLAEGDRIIESTVKVTGEQTNKGLSGNSFEDKENIRIEDADGNDVTSNYTIVLLEGILTVT